MLTYDGGRVKFDFYVDGELMSYPTWNQLDTVTNRPMLTGNIRSYEVRHAHYSNDLFIIHLTDLQVIDHQWLFARALRVTTIDGQSMNPTPNPWRCWITPEKSPELPGSVEPLIPGMPVRSWSEVLPPDEYNRRVDWTHRIMTVVSYVRDGHMTWMKDPT